MPVQKNQYGWRFLRRSRTEPVEAHGEAPSGAIKGTFFGRKSTLIATLLLMGLATAAVAVVPTYESIGIWGAVILTALRFIQGVGVGGEWGGSVLMSMEWARDDRSRGFIASWPQFGVPCGLFLANLAVLGFSQMAGDQFLAWGWRLPFALSLVLVGVGLYIRLGILETPVFAKLVAERQIDRTPMLTVIKQYPKEILLSAFARMAEQAPFYIFTAFVLRHRHAARLARLPADGGPVGFGAVVLFDPVLRTSLRPDRPQERVHGRRGRDRHLRFRLFRDAQHGIGDDHLPRHHPVADSA